MDEIGTDKRIELHNILISLLEKNNVYFQPPSSIKLIYPCIIYELNGIDTNYANSRKYKNKKKYTISLIDQNPDSEIPNKILNLDYCSFNRFFISDNLNHYVFTLYY